EGLDLLRDPVLEDLEVLRGEPLDDPAILRGIRVDPHEAGSRTEDGALWILRRLREGRRAGRGHDKGEYPAGETRARDHGSPLPAGAGNAATAGIDNRSRARRGRWRGQPP